LLNTGTCINGFAIKDFSDNIIGNYNSVTMENEMKPEAILNHSKSIAAGDIVVEYPKRTLDLLNWSKENNMKVRGHVLVWYSQTPGWIFYEDFDTKKALVDRDTMLARMDSYIKQNFEILETLGYMDMFYAYDIVNEAVNDNGTLRDCLWKQIIGDDYIWHAFYYADKYAPEHVKLYYNDFNEQFKTNHVVKLAESLVDEAGRSLIDGIGCQAHLYTKDSIDKYISTLEAFSATGLDVQITEIDVSLGTWQNILQPTDENLREQGRYYYELVSRIIESNKAGTTNVSGITFWGISDGVSWRRDRNPLLFDLDFKPKYAYFGAILDKAHSGY
jgi:endo-1,4-beta-xylanase